MSSIETLIAENTKAVVTLTEALNKQNDLSERMIGLKADAIETVKQTASKPDAAPKAAAKKTETEAAPEPEKKVEAAPEKTEEKPLDPIGQAISDYVGSGYDAADPKAADERKARAAKVKEIFAVIADKAKATVTKHTEIPADFHGPFLKTLAKRVAEGNLVIGVSSEIDLDA